MAKAPLYERETEAIRDLAHLMRALARTLPQTSLVRMAMDTYAGDMLETAREREAREAVVLAWQQAWQ